MLIYFLTFFTVMEFYVSLDDLNTQFNDMSPEQYGELPDLLDSLISLIENGDDIDLANVAELINSVKNVVNRLLQKIDGLEKRVKMLESLYRDILIGQIAMKLEKVLVEHILKDANGDKRYVTLGLLGNAIDGDGSRRCRGIFLSDDEKQKTINNWDILDKTLKLKPAHYRAIDDLKHKRNSKAHPFKTLDEAEKILKKQVGVDDIVFELLEKLKNMQVEDTST